MSTNTRLCENAGTYRFPTADSIPTR
jgi:hypothetical protein